MRDFFEVYENIKKAAGADFSVRLDNASGFWAPETLWFKLFQFVNKYMKKDSKDPTSIKVYAILCNTSEEEMKEKFEKDGF